MRNGRTVSRVAPNENPYHRDESVIKPRAGSRCVNSATARRGGFHGDLRVRIRVDVFAFAQPTESQCHAAAQSVKARIETTARPELGVAKNLAFDTMLTVIAEFEPEPPALDGELKDLLVADAQRRPFQVRFVEGSVIAHFESLPAGSVTIQCGRLLSRFAITTELSVSEFTSNQPSALPLFGI
jgi:hypothetical protein